jgi:hypothetical protein
MVEGGLASSRAPPHPELPLFAAFFEPLSAPGCSVRPEGDVQVRNSQAALSYASGSAWPQGLASTFVPSGQEKAGQQGSVPAGSEVPVAQKGQKPRGPRPPSQAEDL